MFHHHHGGFMATHTEPAAAQVRPLHPAPALTLAKVGGRYLRAAEVTAICGVGKSYIYAHMKAGTFLVGDNYLGRSTTTILAG